MTRDEILCLLREHCDELRREFAVKSLALFGSTSRDEATETSDVDVLVDFDGPVSLFDLVGLQLHLQEFLGVRKVDVVMRDAIYPAIKDNILKEAIDVEPPEVAAPSSRAHPRAGGTSRRATNAIASRLRTMTAPNAGT